MVQPHNMHLFVRHPINAVHKRRNKCSVHRRRTQEAVSYTHLDKEAAALPAEEQPAKPTKFETDKEKLRQTIRTALSSAASYGEFAAVLLQQGVTVKAVSYTHLDVYKRQILSCTFALTSEDASPLTYSR